MPADIVRMMQRNDKLLKKEIKSFPSAPHYPKHQKTHQPDKIILQGQTCKGEGGVEQAKYQHIFPDKSANNKSPPIDKIAFLLIPPNFKYGKSRKKQINNAPKQYKKLKWRGFNQSEEIGKELANFFGIPLITNCLIKIKETVPQVELADEERKENIKGAFFIKNADLIKDKKILLVDDVYTTGATMTECARILKTVGTKEIIGVVIARG